MAKTKTRLRSEAAEVEAKFMPDTSEVLYTFENGWTIRKLRTYADAVREGTLMSNCLLPDDDDEFTAEAWQEHPNTKWYLWEEDDKTELPEDHDFWGDPNVFPQWGDLTKLDLSLEYPVETISLRDTDNIPHVTSDHKDTFGRNNSEAKRKYEVLLDEYWIKVEEYNNKNGLSTLFLGAVKLV